LQRTGYINFPDSDMKRLLIHLSLLFHLSSSFTHAFVLQSARRQASEVNVIRSAVEGPIGDGGKNYVPGDEYDNRRNSGTSSGGSRTDDVGKRGYIKRWNNHPDSRTGSWNGKNRSYRGKNEGSSRGKRGKLAATSPERVRNMERILAICRNANIKAAEEGTGISIAVAPTNPAIAQQLGMNKRMKTSRGNSNHRNKNDNNVLQSSVVTLTEMNHAITTAGRLGRVQDAMAVFDAIPNIGYAADLMSYNNIIWCTGNARRVEEAMKIFQQLNAHPHLKPNVYTYGSLMHGFAQTKAYRKALYYLDDMHEKGIMPNQIVISSAMEACAESQKYEEALAILNRATQIGLKPDLTMVNTAIKACSLAGAMDEAENLAESLREYGSMDLFTYHTLMMGNTKLGRYQRVLALYREALDSSARLDGGVYSLAMLSALNCQLFTEVPRIAEAAAAGGVQLTEAAYTTLIQAFSELGGIEQAVNCLDVMEADGLAPNAITYAAAMAAARDRPSVVVQLLTRMQKAQVSPNTILLTTAINSLARGGGEYADRAYAMMKDMEENGPEPNIYTYNTITRAFAETGRLDDAMDVLQSIEQRRLQPDQYTFTTLLVACGRTNSSTMVDTIMEKMQQAGVKPDPIAYGAAIDAHRRAGNSLKAVACLNDMRKYGLEPSAAHYNLVIRTLRAEGYIDKMFRMVMTMSLKEEAKINVNTFELVIESLLGVNQWKEALLLIRAMDKLSYKPTIGICVMLVEVLERERQYKAVLAMYKYMERRGYDFYENVILNEVFKRLVKVASLGARADIKRTASLNVFFNEAGFDEEEGEDTEEAGGGGGGGGALGSSSGIEEGVSSTSSSGNVRTDTAASKDEFDQAAVVSTQ